MNEWLNGEVTQLAGTSLGVSGSETGRLDIARMRTHTTENRIFQETELPESRTQGGDLYRMNRVVVLEGPVLIACFRGLLKVFEIKVSLNKDSGLHTLLQFHRVFPAALCLLCPSEGGCMSLCLSHGKCFMCFDLCALSPFDLSLSHALNFPIFCACFRSLLSCTPTKKTHKKKPFPYCVQ